MNLEKRWRALALGAATVLVVLLGALGVQHLRHGWPFSLHHDFAHAPEAGHGDHAPVVGSAPAAHARGPVQVEPDRLSAIGVRLEPVRRETISRALRAIATVVPDESRISHVHTRVSGWIEKLHVNTTGETVRAGQALAGIFSQELLSSQNEYLAAQRGAGQGPLSVVLQGARSRLKVLGVSDAEIRALDESGKARRLVTVTAPRGGVVVHRGISVGTAVDPSTELLTIADLSRVWVLAEIPESDIPYVQRDSPAQLEFAASGRPPFEARVDFLAPTLTERTRTLRVRFVVENPDGSLRPGLYGQADFQVKPHDALTIPLDAIVDTGQTQHVYVVEHAGHFVPRVVTLGARLEDRVEVREGLREGESIVASGVFLIDSESRLRASGGGTGHAGHGAPAPVRREEPAPASRDAPAPARRDAPAPVPAGASAGTPPSAPAVSPHAGH